MKKVNTDVLDKEQVSERVKMCKENNLCFISLRPLGDSQFVAKHNKEVGDVGVIGRYAV